MQCLTTRITLIRNIDLEEFGDIPEYGYSIMELHWDYGIPGAGAVSFGNVLSLALCRLLLGKTAFSNSIRLNKYQKILLNF